jgi:hypothetical protein
MARRSLRFITRAKQFAVAYRNRKGERKTEGEETYIRGEGNAENIVQEKQKKL